MKLKRLESHEILEQIMKQRRKIQMTEKTDQTVENWMRFIDI